VIAAIGEVLLGPMVNEFPLLAFDAVPFLFNSREEGQRFWAEIRPQVEKRLAEQGLTILYVQPWQPQGLFSTKPVAGVADLKGTRFRAHSPVFAKYAPKEDAAILPVLKVSPNWIPFSVTLATVLGALRAADAWGGYWSWDPKETWALIVWLNYAAWLHMRLMKGLRGTVAAWWALVGLGITTFAFLGVNMFLSGLHSYGTL
jgi:hypothetical protein